MHRAWKMGLNSFSLSMLLLGLALLHPAAAAMVDSEMEGRGHGKISIEIREKKISDSPIAEESPLSILSEESRRYETANDVSVAENSVEASDFSSTMVPVAAGQGSKELYLTFDDGPLNGTGNVLKVLKEEGVSASMFFVGRHVRQRPNLYNLCRRMPNILVANHTYSHANGHYQRFYRDTYNLMSDVERAQLLIGGRKYLRLAGRNVWRTPEVQRDDRAIGNRQRAVEYSKYETAFREGFFIYGWDVEWHFNHQSGRPLSSADTLANRIENIYRHGRSAQRGKVVLLAHDFMFRDRHSTMELRRFIRLMRERGWRFKKIDQYSRLRPEPLYIAKYYKKSRLASSAAAGKTAHKAKAATRSVEKPAAPRKRIARERVSETHLNTAAKSLQARLNDAIRSYASEQVERFLQIGADVNGRDEYGRTAINTAVRANSIFLVKKLLARGADLDLRDRKGMTALQTARQYQRRTIEEYLIRYANSHGSTTTRHLAVAEQTRITVSRDPLKALR